MGAEDGPSRGHVLAIPYPVLTTVKMKHQPNHPMLIMGTVTTVIDTVIDTASDIVDL